MEDEPTVALVIDDSPSTHEVVKREIGPMVAQLLHATQPGDGIRLALQHRPDLILLDVNMPEMDGFKVCAHLRENKSTRDTPILFLTVEAQLARALECGGTDYIRKPFNAVELRARVGVALRQKRMLDLLRTQAHIDALTGLANRAALDDGLMAAASAHDRAGQPVALMMIDLDHFKQINDNYGHGTGDELLRRVGEAVRSTCRPYDQPCRYGGDEIAVIFGQARGENAFRAATRLYEAITSLAIPVRESSIPVGCSAGLATSDQCAAGFGPKDLLEAADAALYRAKSAGRGRLVWLGEDG